MLIIPAIYLKDGRCVRLSAGAPGGVAPVEDDPLDLARGFEDAGARMLHVVDVDGAFAGGDTSNRKLVRRIIRAVEIPVQFGGGLRAVADVQQLIEYGAAQVLIGTLAARSPATLENFVQLFGFRICVGIDARGNDVVVEGREKQARISAVDLARRVADAGVDRIVFTDVERNGSLAGVNIDQTCAVAKASGTRVTASGGVATLEDIRLLQGARGCGIDSVIVGKALYEGRFTLAEALRVG